VLCPSLDEHPEGFSGCDVAADPNMSRAFLQRMSQSDTNEKMVRS